MNLYADDNLLETIELTDNKKSHIFKDLPEYTMTGEKIEYKILEEELDDYTTEYKILDNKTTIINTKIIDGELSALKEASIDRIMADQEFEYTIRVNNIKKDSRPIQRVNIKDVLPEGIILVEDVMTINGIKYPLIHQDNTIDVTLENIEYGVEQYISFKVKAHEDVFGTLTNIATVTDVENPNKPLEPSVDVIITPKVKWKPLNPSKPKEDINQPNKVESKEVIEISNPQIPNTGISSNISKSIFWISILSVSIILYVKTFIKKNKTN